MTPGGSVFGGLSLIDVLPAIGGKESRKHIKQLLNH
jgi:hypothetical protein